VGLKKIFFCSTWPKWQQFNTRATFKKKRRRNKL
jgi:hypothetical protein